MAEKKITKRKMTDITIIKNMVEKRQYIYIEWRGEVSN